MASRKVLAAVVAAVSLALSSPLTASAATPASGTTAKLEAHLAEFRVPRSKWLDLERKLDHHIPLDAKTSKPVRNDVFTKSGLRYKVARFADGSFTANVMELATARPRIRPMSGGTISGCAYYYGSGVASYSNCLVKHATTVFELSFRANYWRTGGVSQIDHISNDEERTFGGTYSIRDFKIIRSQGSSDSYPAIAELKIDYTVYQGAAEGSGYLRLNVSPDRGAWASSNY